MTHYYLQLTIIQLTLFLSVSFSSSAYPSETGSENMAACEFDRLITKSVPHILEKIFFSLDYISFKNCLEVCVTWNGLLTSKSFQRAGRCVFRGEIDDELFTAIEDRNEKHVRRILSSGMADVNALDEWNYTPLFRNLTLRNSFLGLTVGQKNVAHLLLEAGADPNRGVQCCALNMAALVQYGKKCRNLVWDVFCQTGFFYGHTHLVQVFQANFTTLLADGRPNWIEMHTCVAQTKTGTVSTEALIYAHENH